MKNCSTCANQGSRNCYGCKSVSYANYQKKDIAEKYLICEGCYAIADNNWRHANAFNSSKFCNICGTYCSEKTLYPDELKRLQEKHKKVVKEKEELYLRRGN